MGDLGQAGKYPDDLDRLADMIGRMGRRGDARLASTIRDAAAEIRRLRAEMEVAHTQIDKADIPRDWGSAPLELGQRIDLKLQSLADMIEARDDELSRLRTEPAS